jgi:hypothetical protein
MRKQLLIVVLLFFKYLLHGQDLETIGKEKPVRFNGGLSLGANFYHVEGIEPRSKPFLWSINGSPTVTLFGISFPFYFNIGAQNRSFAQPFNQFGVSPKYKWLTLHAGWRSLNYSNYTLGGLVMLGGGFEMRPGIFRLSAIAGRLNKVVREDSTQKNFGFPPSYKRMCYAGRIGIGNDRTFIDLIVMKAKDDSSSYKDAPISLRPQENLVLGINGKAMLFKHVQLGLDVAASAYTRDQKLDSINDPLFNRYNFFKPNVSSQLLFAGNSYIGYVSRFINLKLNYRRVDQDFKSMGAFIYQTDVEAYTIEPSFNLLKGKVRVSGSVGIQSDNLLRNKLITTDRTIGSVNLSVQATREYGFDIQYGNYGIAQRAGIIPVNDTTRLALANQNFTLINRYTKGSKTSTFSIIGLMMYQNLTSLNEFQKDLIGNTVVVGNINCNYGLPTAGISYSAGFNISQTEFNQGIARQFGPTLGASFAFFKKKLNTSVGTSFMSNQFAGDNSGLTINGNINLNYRITKGHSFISSLRITHNNADTPVTNPFTEFWMSAGYQFNF